MYISHAPGCEGISLFIQDYKYLLQMWEGIKEQYLPPPFWAHLGGGGEGTPKGSLVTPLLGLLITQVIFIRKVNGPLIS